MGEELHAASIARRVHVREVDSSDLLKWPSAHPLDANTTHDGGAASTARDEMQLDFHNTSRSELKDEGWACAGG